jgi:hypothetical protein
MAEKVRYNDIVGALGKRQRIQANGGRLIFGFVALPSRVPFGIPGQPPPQLRWG